MKLLLTNVSCSLPQMMAICACSRELPALTTERPVNWVDMPTDDDAVG
jgi:hypothetical protein